MAQTVKSCDSGGMEICDSQKSSEMGGLDCGVGSRSDNVVILGTNGTEDAEIVGNETERSGYSDSGSDSSSSTSSSSVSSSDDDDDDDDDDEEEEEEERSVGLQEEEVDNTKRKETGEELEMEEGEIAASDADEMVAWSDNEDGDDSGAVKDPIRSKNEVKDLPPVPPVNVTLQPHHQTLPIGVVSSIIGSQVIVEGVEKHNPLNEGSILWVTESRTALGLVDEIFGPVKNPYYIVRYNSESEVPAGIKLGTPVSFVQEFANHVLNDSSLYKKGYDASGENDEELPGELEFSDDEKEAEYRRTLKMKKRGTNDGKSSKKKAEKKDIRSMNWKRDKALQKQAEPGNVTQLAEGRPHHGLPIASSLVQVNYSDLAQGMGGGPILGPPAQQQAQAQAQAQAQNLAFGTPMGVWTNGISCQQAQNVRLPGGFPALGMSWPPQQNHAQQLFQMSSPGGLPFQQQIGPGPSLPPNLAGHASFGMTPGFTPSNAFMGQNLINQSAFGLGLPGQFAPLGINVGEQAVQSNGQQLPNHTDLRPPAGASWNFNQGAHVGGGGRPQRRGGGRFGGGRGRQQHS